MRAPTEWEALDDLCWRIDAMIDGRDYSELETVATGWARWAFYATDLTP